MKTKELDQRAVVQRANYYIYSIWYLKLNNPIRLDMRFNFNKAVLSYIRKNPLTQAQKEAVLNKKKERSIRKSGMEFTNILQNKILVDYLAHKKDVKQILSDGIIFWGNRNHWAKNAQDLKVIAILRKHFINQ